MSYPANYTIEISDPQYQRFIKSISFLQKIAKSITEMDKSTLTTSERIELNDIGGKIVNLTSKSLIRKINQMNTHK